MNRTGNKASRIKDLIPGVFENMGISDRLDEGRLVRDWPEIAGESISSNSRVIDLRDGILYVVAKNNLWMQEISFLQNDLIEKIGERFPGLEVNGLRTFIEKGKGEE
ncbi:MAG: DUF721 domain-containing protein [Candidatus Latescibacteria bacterium]|nr:DUF721 domain-containing protein [bacterium]MBD3425431.1 DUF721 domain-containing protein [Candidatus Latescibacterota bacterium]